MSFEIIVEALKLPFREEDWIGTMFAGSLLALASLLVLPAPLFLGYVLRVMSQDDMPGFDNLVQMYIDGLKAFGVVTLYFLPGFIFIAAFDGILALTGFVLLVIGWWGMESGLYHLANGGFRQAFTVEALRTAFTLNYLIGIVASIVVPFAITMAYSVSLLLLVTVLLFPTALFYETVVRYRIMRNAIER